MDEFQSLQCVCCLSLLLTIAVGWAWVHSLFKSLVEGNQIELCSLVEEMLHGNSGGEEHVFFFWCVQIFSVSLEMLMAAVIFYGL